ncbi:MAG: PPC domain-containing protein [Treponema sp.]|jgi:hypothetical protein|nr:PPC domain-containing protein [Treponema sp.]
MIFCTSSITVTAQETAQSPADMDIMTARLAILLSQKLSGKVMVGDFLQGEEDTYLGRFWQENLLGELTNQANRSYTLLAPGSQSQADYMISGNIIELGGMVRVYARLIRNSDSSVMSIVHVDIERNNFIDELLSPIIAGSGSTVRRDQYEPDSRLNPVTVQIGAGSLNRTIHANDQDWFKVVSGSAQHIIAETEGDLDTVMELYESVSGFKLQENDDGGRGSNARIRWSAEAGKEYILMVRGYSGETGAYSFMVNTFEIPDSGFEPNDTLETATRLILNNGEAVNALISGVDDVDWYQVEIPPAGGEITVYTQGDMDTLLALLDPDGTVLTEDDDSGSGYNAWITQTVRGGPLYIKISAYDDGGPYSLHIEFTENR